jgi:hypothetical protein
VLGAKHEEITAACKVWKLVFKAFSTSVQIGFHKIA